MLTPWFLAALLCCASLHLQLGRAVGPPSDATPEEQALIAWLESLGAYVGVTVRREPGSGVRGLAAAGRASQGQVLVRVPVSAALALGTAEQTAPELAIQLLRERYRTRPRYGPYFDVLPPPPPETEAQAEAAAADVAAGAKAAAEADRGVGQRDETLVTPPPPAEAAVAGVGRWQPSCVEEFPQEAVEALAGADLRSLATAKREWMRQVWAGEGPAAAALRLPLARAVPRRRVSAREFAWATCMVTSRSIAGPPAAVGSSGPASSASPPATMLLIPLIDLANHCILESNSSSSGSGSGSETSRRGRSTPDVLRFGTEGPAEDGSSSGGGRVVLELIAGEDLEPGQEVCISYGDLRPDESLLYYGFVSPLLQPPPEAPLPPAAGQECKAAEEEAQAHASGQQQQQQQQQQCAVAAVAASDAAAGGTGGSSSSARAGSCAWDGGSPSPASRLVEPALLPLAAVDEAQYDAAARPGKASYSRLGEEVRDAAAAGEGRQQWVAALEAEAARLAARLAEVQAEAEAAWAGAAAGCVRHAVPQSALCQVAQLNDLRAAALRTELGRLRALRAGVRGAAAYVAARARDGQEK